MKTEDIVREYLEAAGMASQAGDEKSAEAYRALAQEFQAKLFRSTGK